jgi:hypothetical protein
LIQKATSILQLLVIYSNNIIFENDISSQPQDRSTKYATKPDNSRANMEDILSNDLQDDQIILASEYCRMKVEWIGKLEGYLVQD